MTIEPAFLIAVDRADDEELNAVQEIVKANSRSWWHRFTNVWLVGGGDSSAHWRSLVKPALKSGQSSVLVLKLPAPASRGWSLSGPNAKEWAAWLHRNYK